MATDETKPVRAVIGDRLRRLRAETPWLARQEDVAARMRQAVGFDWTRATVAAVELGRRDVTIEELVGLSYACGIALHEWFDGDGAIPLSPLGVVTHRGMRQVFGSGEGGEPIAEWFIPDTVQHHRPTRQRMKAWAADNEDEVADVIARGVLARIWPDHVPVKDPRQAILDSEGDAEQKAARSMQRRGITIRPLEVSLLAHAIWGHGLTTERDERVARTTADDATPRTTQAIRGHITRSLLDELTAALRNGSDHDS